MTAIRYIISDGSLFIFLSSNLGVTVNHSFLVRNFYSRFLNCSQNCCFYINTFSSSAQKNKCSLNMYKEPLPLLIFSLSHHNTISLLNLPILLLIILMILNKMTNIVHLHQVLLVQGTHYQMIPFHVLKFKIM